MFEDNGFIGIPCWGGVVMRKPGYKNVLFDYETPEAVQISDAEMYRLVAMLRGAAE